MFHHHTENSPSTGEPPTPPLDNLATAEDRLTSGDQDMVETDFETVSADELSSEQSRSTQGRAVPRLYLNATASPQVDIPSERGRQNTIPSHDSGYERSPSNLNQPNSPQFFMDYVFMDEDNCSGDVLIENDELCSECDAENLCNCASSNSSATMVQTPGSPPSSAFGHFCDTCSYSSELSSSFQPPSSLPIEIPVASSRRPTHSLPSTSFSWRIRQRPPSRSLPIEHNSSHASDFQAFLSRSHPRMWPNVIISMTRLSSIDLLGGLRQVSRTSLSSRLRSIDSSYSSSIESFFDAANMSPIDDDLDNVFPQESYEMADEDLSSYPEYRRRLNSDALLPTQPLPDLILQSSPRRNRSASVNLPPDHAVLRNIGRSLRRISDDFRQGANDRQLSPCQQQRPAFPVFTIFRRD